MYSEILYTHYMYCLTFGIVASVKVKTKSTNYIKKEDSRLWWELYCEDFS